MNRKLSKHKKSKKRITTTGILRESRHSTSNRECMSSRVICETSVGKEGRWTRSGLAHTSELGLLVQIYRMKQKLIISTVYTLAYPNPHQQSYSLPLTLGLPKFTLFHFISRILDIDASQRVLLEAVKNGKKLGRRIPYTQLRPFLHSQLHGFKGSSHQALPEISYDVAPLASAIDLEGSSHQAHPDESKAGASKGSSHQLQDARSVSAVVVHCLLSFICALHTLGFFHNALLNLSCMGFFNNWVLFYSPVNQQQRDVPLAPGLRDPTCAAKEIVHNRRKWLNDLEIDHSQFLLGRTFPLISGFQSSIVFESHNYAHVRAPKAQFVQILNVHGNHWLTVSNLKCKENTIKIYDSLNSQLETCDKFNCQVASMMDCQSSSINVKVMSMMSQKGSSDCGLFAIAYAVSLCFGISPESQNFDQDQMRGHLAKCFMEGKLSPFPACPTNLTPSNFHSYDILLCCKCRFPKFPDDTSTLIQCMSCCRSFHEKCDTCNSSCDFFFCTDCQLDIDLL